MYLNVGQLNALRLAETRQNLFITGQGGVGKSELIKHIKQSFEDKRKVCFITALTGIAALNIKGMTLHRWAGIGLGEEKQEDLLRKVKKNPKGHSNWFNTSVLVIDEVSMLSPELFTKLDYIGRNIRRSSAPFGGIQLIFSGDFCQLGPVKIDAYCFESPLWNKCNFKICYLTENMRQADANFQKLLSEVRLGYASQTTKDLLSARIGVNVGTDEIRPTKLYSNRASVDEMNLKELKKLRTPVQVFNARDNITPGKYDDAKKENYLGVLEKTCQARKKLHLKIGAQVLLISNIDPDAGLVNGSRGVITSFEVVNENEYRPIVKFMNDIVRTITHVVWELEITDSITVSRSQIPLILAFGITTHKAQSLTIDCIDVDLGNTIFAPGQFYTALSRVRSLEGLSISQLNFDKLICDPKVRDFYEHLDLQEKFGN